MSQRGGVNPASFNFRRWLPLSLPFNLSLSLSLPSPSARCLHKYCGSDAGVFPGAGVGIDDPVPMSTLLSLSHTHRR